MQQFELLLRNEKLKLYDRFAILLFILNAVAICFFLYYKYEDIAENPLSLTCAGAALLMLIFFIFLPARSKNKNIFLLAAAPVILYWVVVGYWPAAIILGFLFFFYTVAKKPLYVRVTGEKVIYPSFPKRVITWEQLSNLILKDGLLTIDFKNNRIIQQTVEVTTKPVNEQEFNDFCKAQMT